MENNLRINSYNPENAYEWLKENATKYLNFGISYLDDSIGGVGQSDLIILGAYSGQGKTEIAVDIALRSCLTGKNVYFYALEAHNFEIENRIIYKLAAKKYFDNVTKIFRKYNVNYSAYMRNKIDIDFDLYVREAIIESERLYKDKLFIKYRGNSDFNIENFRNDLMAIDLNADLIIIDHLHYFDFDETKEYAEINKIIKAIRDIVLLCEIPIILIAHLKKPDRKLNKVCPSLDDIHGSSNIYKIATNVIFIAKTEIIDAADIYKFGTFIRVVKSRQTGALDNYLGCVFYDIQTNAYEEKYKLAKITNMETGYEFLGKDKVPWWAKSANNL